MKTFQPWEDTFRLLAGIRFAERKIMGEQFPILERDQTEQGIPKSGWMRKWIFVLTFGLVRTVCR